MLPKKDDAAQVIRLLHHPFFEKNLYAGLGFLESAGASAKPGLKTLGL